MTPLAISRWAMAQVAAAARVECGHEHDRLGRYSAIAENVSQDRSPKQAVKHRTFFIATSRWVGEKTFCRPLTVLKLRSTARVNQVLFVTTLKSSSVAVTSR